MIEISHHQSMMEWLLMDKNYVVFLNDIFEEFIII